jgi:hypothetical protein
MKKAKGIQYEDHPSPKSIYQLSQIPLKVDGTRSLFPVAAEEATLSAQRILSARKTQSPLPRSLSSALSFSPSNVGEQPQCPCHSHPHSQRMESVSLSFLKSDLHTAHDRIHMSFLPT